MNSNQSFDQFPATDNILPYYLSADACILPSLSEGSPNVILESFATGTPIISSEAANHANIVQHQSNGWVFPTGNYMALAECLITALETTHQERTLMGERGRVVAREYTIERMIEQYQQLYERAINLA